MMVQETRLFSTKNVSSRFKVPSGGAELAVLKGFGRMIGLRLNFEI